MLLNCFSQTTNISPPPISLLKLKPKKKPNLIHFHPNSYYPPNLSSTITCALGVTFDDIAAIAQNKVIIAAGVSGAIGQLSKPFTSVVLYGKPLDFRAVIQAGGFPSTHSSAVVATATSLALERGFSDSIFGMTLVYAGLVMYDAQGVRREVGIHAKTINRVLLEDQLKSLMEGDGEDSIDSAQGNSSSANLRSSSLSEEPITVKKEQKSAPLLLESRLQKSMSTLVGEELGRTKSYSLLKESIGHTEVEVIAGALLGFLVSLAVHTII